MSHSLILRSLSLVALAAVTGASLPLNAPARAEALRADGRPNVLIIITDDQRAQGTLGVMPSVRRWFVREGRRFSRAFVTTPTCCPSRASIFTGLYAHNHGVHTTEPGDAENLDQSRTMQNRLHGSGYLTGLFGKYLNWWDIAAPPPDFDRWALLSGGAAHYYRGGIWNIDGELAKVRTYTTTFIRRRALAFLRAAEAEDPRPWMMVVTPTAPHIPTIPQRRDRGAPVPPFRSTPAMRERDRSDKPAFTHDRRLSRAEIRDLRARQLRTLMSVDRMVGAIHETLRENGELKDTLAFFTSDNGFMWGEHGLTGKSSAYEDAVRVPFLMSWPGRVPAGSRDDRLVANIDIAPTIFEATNTTPVASVDGRSILDAFERDRLLLEYWRQEHNEAPDWAAHRTTSYKYIETYVADHLIPEWREFYDLDRDRWELDNMVGPGYVGTTPDPTRLRADLLCTGTQGPAACP